MFILLNRGVAVLTADDIADFGVLRKGLDADHIKALKPEARDELENDDDDVDEEGAKALFEAEQEEDTRRRKRAAVGKVL